MATVERKRKRVTFQETETPTRKTQRTSTETTQSTAELSSCLPSESDLRNLAEKSRATRKHRARAGKFTEEEASLDHDYTGVDYEVEGGRDKDEPPLEKFNMKDELERGYFDPKTGSYIENRGEEIINDPWYDEWEEQQEEREDKEESKQLTLNKEELAMEAGDQNLEELDLDATIQQILGLLKENETILMALRRLRPQKVVHLKECFATQVNGSLVC